MGDDDRRRTGQNGPLKDFPGMDDGGVRRPDRDQGIADHGMLGIQIQGEELFPAVVDQMRSYEPGDIVSGTDQESFLLAVLILDSDFPNEMVVKCRWRFGDDDAVSCLITSVSLRFSFLRG